MYVEADGKLLPFNFDLRDRLCNLVAVPRSDTSRILEQVTAGRKR